MAHGHAHPRNYNRTFAIGVGLNVVFVVVEVIYGLLADSLALLADAGHNLSDVVALLIAWGASYLATLRATDKRTYGLKRVTIMASALSTVLLMLALGAIGWEAVERLTEPATIAGETVIIVAAIGVAVNSATALLFVADRKRDLNIRAAYWHMAADAAISLGVVLGGILLVLTGWLWLDPVLSLLIVAVIFAGSWSLLRDSLNLSVDAVPAGVNVQAVRDELLKQEWVCGLHDLHIWALSTTETALTVHVLSTRNAIDNDRLRELQEALHREHGIEHSTIQVESAEQAGTCLLDKPQCH